jgi:hypothetical protein
VCVPPTEIRSVFKIPFEKFATLPKRMPASTDDIVPLLVMPPEKAEIGWAPPFAMPTRIPLLPEAEISPLLEMPPAKVVMLLANMPGSMDAEIVPPLLMPPKKVVTLLANIPTPDTDIVPLLVIPPEKAETGPAFPRRMPLRAEIVPPLEMPPAKVVMLPAVMPGPAADIVPLLVMPPEKVKMGAAPLKVWPRIMPVPPDVIEPAFEMPFEKREILPTSRPAPTDAVIVPLLLLMTDPKKVATFTIAISAL